MSIDEIFNQIRLGTIIPIKKFPNINIVNEEGQNLLHQSISVGNVIMVEKLLDTNINVNHRDNNGQTPLHYCAAHDELEIAKMLIEKGGDINITDNHGNNAAWTAAFNAKGKYDMVMLFNENDGEFSNKNNYGKTSIDFANQIQDKQLLRAMIN